MLVIVFYVVSEYQVGIIKREYIEVVEEDCNIGIVVENFGCFNVRERVGFYVKGDQVYGSGERKGEYGVCIDCCSFFFNMLVFFSFFLGG